MSVGSKGGQIAEVIVIDAKGEELDGLKMDGVVGLRNAGGDCCRRRGVGKFLAASTCTEL